MSARFWNSTSNVIWAVTGLLLMVWLAATSHVAYEEWKKPQRPAEPPPGYVLRRLEIRLHEPIDKGRGDRYRRFECTEVPR